MVSRLDTEITILCCKLVQSSASLFYDFKFILAAILFFKQLYLTWSYNLALERDLQMPITYVLPSRSELYVN